MRGNTRFPVAVHMLALIALGGEHAPTSEMMAVSTGSHPVMVRQIMSALKKAGLIETRSGVPGGRLARAPEEISLQEVYRAVGAERSLFDLHARPSRLCPVGRNIKNALADPLAAAQNAMENTLKDWSLRDVTAYILKAEKGELS